MIHPTPRHGHHTIALTAVRDLNPPCVPEYPTWNVSRPSGPSTPVAIRGRIPKIHTGRRPHQTGAAAMSTLTSVRLCTPVRHRSIAPGRTRKSLIRVRATLVLIR